MLELAYWIGPRPGVWNEEIEDRYDLGDYRDERRSGRRNPEIRDRWVVFHLHIDSTQQVFFEHQRHTYAAIVSTRNTLLFCCLFILIFCCPHQSLTRK